MTNIRAERVQDITEAGAADEGVRCVFGGIRHDCYRDAFRALWNSIYAAPQPVKSKGIITHYESYPFEGMQEVREYKGLKWYVHGNPWVWVIGFEKTQEDVINA